MKRKRQKRLNYFLFSVIILFSFACENQRAEHQFVRAQKLYHQASYLEAIRNWEIILNSFPRSNRADDALHWIGMTYYLDLDLPERAVSAFLRLVKEYPDSQYAPQDLMMVGDIFRNQRQYSKALTEYARFLQIYSEDERAPKVWYNLIICLFEVEEYSAMQVQAQEFLKKYPTSEWADDCIYWLGQSYFLQGEQKKARDYFQTYLKQYPSGELAFNAEMGLARSLEEEGLLKDAIDAYQKLKERYPTEKPVETRLQSVQKRYQNQQIIPP